AVPSVGEIEAAALMRWALHHDIRALQAVFDGLPGLTTTAMLHDRRRVVLAAADGLRTRLGVRMPAEFDVTEVFARPISQADVARAAGSTQPLVSDALRGRSAGGLTPEGADRLRAIALLLGYPAPPTMPVASATGDSPARLNLGNGTFVDSRELALAARVGDRTALDHLCERYRYPIYRWVSAVTGNRT